MIGIDHTAAEIDMRSVFSFTKTRSMEAMEAVCREEGINGCIILSTCNRMELWVSTEDSCSGNLLELLCRIKHVDPETFSGYFTERSGRDAVDHIFDVASGIMSQIVGEDQIITQVKDALAASRECQAADGTLEVLFRMAVTAAKKVKTEVAFPKGQLSAVDGAVHQLIRSGYTIEGSKCLVIGNGEMGKESARAFRDAGASVTMTIRRYRHRDVEIPDRCEAVEYDSRLEIMGGMDYIVSATSSPHYTITEEMAAGLTRRKEVVMIDLAVPRDIEQSVRDLPGITLFDIDDFGSDGGDQALRSAMDQAEKILDAQKEEFYGWYGGRNQFPRIEIIKEDIAQDVSMRLHKKIRRLNLTEEEKEQLTADIENSVGKAANKMIYGLRASMDEAAFDQCLKGLEVLYEDE